ncbi:MAG: homoserine kinase [Silvanigrellaceae bacterium]
MAKISVFAPATIANLGPGFDVLGMAVEGAGDVFTVELINGASVVEEIRGKDADKVPLNPRINATVVAAEAFLASKNIRSGIRLWSERSLPISGGMGSSAAASTGGALAAALAAGVPFSDNDVLRAALAGESLVAGRHLDNIAPCFYGGLVAVQSTEPPVVQKLPLASGFKCIVVTPELQLATKTARAVLPDSLPTARWTRQMALAVGLAVGLSTGNEKMIRESLQDPFAEAGRAHLIPNFSKVKTAAIEAGALGCSISGAGPSVFALVDSRQDAESIADAMVKGFLPLAAQARVCEISNRGARKI